MDTFPWPLALPSSALCFTNGPGILPTCPGCPALLEGDLSSPAPLLHWPSSALCPGCREMPLHVTLHPGPLPRTVSPPPQGIPRDTVPSVAGVTYGPEVTMTLRTRSKPRSPRFRHSVVNSICLPWKFSCSKTMIWGQGERVGQGQARSGRVGRWCMSLHGPCVHKSTAPRVPLGSPRLPAAFQVWCPGKPSWALCTSSPVPTQSEHRNVPS